MEEDQDKPKAPKTYLSKAYLKHLEKNLYGLFRNLEIEDEHGNREKIKEIGPLKMLRKAKLPEEDKRVVLKTYEPATQEEIGLVELEGT